MSFYTTRTVSNLPGHERVLGSAASPAPVPFLPMEGRQPPVPVPRQVPEGLLSPCCPLPALGVGQGAGAGVGQPGPSSSPTLPGKETPAFPLVQHRRGSGARREARGEAGGAPFAQAELQGGDTTALASPRQGHGAGLWGRPQRSSTRGRARPWVLC